MDTEGVEEIHDVFLSFRGKDTRNGFISHLYAALSQVGIQTFMDDRLQRGEKLWTSICSAINMSRMSIVILSPHYANSKWCLNELVKIMECNQKKNHIIVPVFYHVYPFEVRNLKAAVGRAFTDLINRIPVTEDEVRTWKEKLSEVASFAGWETGKHQSERKLIEDIVKDVSRKVNNRSLFIANYPVRIGPRVQEIMHILQRDAKANDVFILGVWGMGGIGKTTIAKAIFNALCRRDNRSSFIANIREAWECHMAQSLQEKLVSDILGETHLKIHSIEKSLRHIKALVLLDDVNDEDQLKVFCGHRDWFAPSSIIIITTRNRALLDQVEADYVLKMNEMESSQSLELFSWHAFRLPRPTKDFIELSNSMVAYCGGLPLALEVIGSFLLKRTILEWEDVLSKLKKIPNGRVHDKLKISFDGLSDYMEKDIFLDICCFFIGKNKDYVSTILNGCGLHAEIGIKVLIERSLVKVNMNNKFEMHDLLRDMGREVIRNESPKMLGERSRLWSHEDALDVLKRNTGTMHIEGLSLRLPNKTCLSTEAFKQITRLRLLHLSHIELAGNYDDLMEDLRWICWPEFPWSCPPKNFYKGRLVAIDFRHSNLERFWKVPQFLHELKILNLSHSHYLEITPDFSYMPNLERLILKDCQRLSDVHQTIGDLNRLRLVNFKGCKCLGHLPRNFYRLKSLKTMILSDSNIEMLEEDIEQMESLENLVAENTAITTPPFSIVRLKSIKYISLGGYKGIPSDVFPCLIRSWMSPSNTPRCLTQAFASTSSLVSLGIGNATNYLLPKTTQSTTQISDRDDLASAVSHNQVVISRLENSTSPLLIEIAEQSILQDWTANQSMGSSFPFEKHPNWRSYSNEGRGVRFEVPYVDCNLEGMILSIDYSCSQDNMASPFPFSIQVHNNTKGTIQLCKLDSITTFDGKIQWQGIASIMVPGDEVEVIVVFGLRYIAKKTTIYLVYGQSLNKGMECSSTSNKESTSNKDVVSIDKSYACRKARMANPKRFGLDDDEEEGSAFRIAKRQR